MSEANLSAALVAAQKGVDVASKDATNKHHNYDYASAEEIVAVGSAALSAAGLALAEEGSSFEFFPVDLLRRPERSEKPYADGIGGALGLLTVVYALVHESGERREIRHVFPVVPEKGRPLDKALAASRTECLAYALRGLLLMQRREKGHRKPKTKLPDVSGRADEAAPKPLPRPADHVAAAPPAATRQPPREVPQALKRIEAAQKGEDALVALAQARQDRSVDPAAAEDCFAQWLVTKAKATTNEETLTRIEGALRRASLTGSRNSEVGNIIAEAKRGLAAGRPS